MGAIDSSIVNVVVPHLSGSLGATVQEITWVITGFVISTVVVMPLTGFLARLFGQKRVYLTALVLFIAGSALCGFAHTLGTLVFFRVLQGLGAGALQPTEQAILRQTFPPAEQGMAMAVFGMAVVLGPAFGPTLGGWIVDNYSWPWIFFINVPIGLLSIVLVTRFVHEPEDIRHTNMELAERQKKNMDWVGIGLMVMGLASMQYVLEEGNRDNWFDSNVIKAVTFVAVFAIILLIIRELSAKMPAVDFSLFRDTAFLSGTLIGAVMFAMLLSMTFLLPLFMQQMLGFTATQAGMAMMPRSLVMMVAMPVVGRLYNKVSPRAVIGFGILLFGYSAWLMGHYTLATGTRDVIIVLSIQGVAFACLFIPLTTLALSNIPRARLADATGMNSLFRQTGGSIGLAVFATLMTRYGTTTHASMIGNVSMSRPEAYSRIQSMTGMFMARGYDAVAAKAAAIRMIDFNVTGLAMVLAFEKLFLLGGISFLTVMPLLLFLKRHGGAPTEKIEVHVEM